MKKIALLSSVAVLMLAGVRAQADVLDVLNPGFEDPSIGSSKKVVPSTITDWDTLYAGNVGLANSAKYTVTGDVSGQVAVLASYIPTGVGGFPATLYQSDIASVNDADKYYTFSIDLAQGSTHVYSTPGSFTLTLTDSTGVIATETLSTSELGVNDFQPFSVTGYAGTGPNDFTVLFSATGDGVLVADNASLTGSPVPEPSNWGWIPFLGTLSFLALRRFRQKA